MDCKDCGFIMRENYICDKEKWVLGTIYQCPKCKRIDYEDYKRVKDYKEAIP